MGTISSGIKSKINYLTRAIKQGRILSVYDLMLIRSEFIQLEHNYTLLEKRLSWCYEERNHFVRVINEAIRIANVGDKRIAELEEDLALHKKIRSAQADMITRLIERSGQLEEEVVRQNAVLDMVDILTKRIEIKIGNMVRNTNLVIEQKEKLQTENETLRETLIQREMAWGGWTRRVAEITVDILIGTEE